eukprot:TRINITY_DN17329_c0_g1_i1.p1 TRINITY_DN17329_c0_g1~~TRINITY_DN17329_c0_g1_i1.p1  ORF type:complete len:844 (+),score=178.61 TRINITY_DN17329_c0_g1_i1:359-2890(+)
MLYTATLLFPLAGVFSGAHSNSLLSHALLCCQYALSAFPILCLTIFKLKSFKQVKPVTRSEYKGLHYFMTGASCLVDTLQLTALAFNVREGNDFRHVALYLDGNAHFGLFWTFTFMMAGWALFLCFPGKKGWGVSVYTSLVNLLFVGMSTVLVRTGSCDFSTNDGLLNVDPSEKCWRGRHIPVLYCSFITLNLLLTAVIPFSSILSVCRQSGECSPPSFPPYFITLDKLLKFLCIAVAVLSQGGYASATLPVYGVCFTVLLLSSRRAEKTYSFFGTQGPCSIKSLNPIITLQYSCVLWGAASAALAEAFEFDSWWSELLLIVVGWGALVGMMWCTTGAYRAGLTEGNKRQQSSIDGSAEGSPRAVVDHFMQEPPTTDGSTAVPTEKYSVASMEPDEASSPYKHAPDWATEHDQHAMVPESPPAHHPPVEPYTPGGTSDHNGGGSEFWNAADDEAEEDYCPGGYHRVAVGDCYAKKYEILCKLGWGQFSTVWLVKDRAWKAADGPPLKALKICKSTSGFRNSALYEVKILKKLSKAAADTRSNPHGDRLITCYDDFEIDGPNGSHVSMVMELMGANLLKLIMSHNFEGINANIVKVVARNVLEGLDFLESAGVIHTDLKPENILLEVHDEAVLQAIHASTGQGSVEEKTRQSKAVLTGMVTKLEGETLEGALKRIYKVKITDLGAARWVDKNYPVTVVQTREYRAPEVLLGCAKLGTGVDIWSFGCIVFELLTGDFLFDPKQQKDMNIDIYHWMLFQQVLGPVPRSFSTSPASHTSDYFTTSGDFKHNALPQTTLPDHIMRKYGFKLPASTSLSAFLLPLLHFNPSERPKPASILEDSWLEIQF